MVYAVHPPSSQNGYYKRHLMVVNYIRMPSSARPPLFLFRRPRRFTDCPCNCFVFLLRLLFCCTPLTRQRPMFLTHSSPNSLIGTSFSGAQFHRHLRPMSPTQPSLNSPIGTKFYAAWFLFVIGSVTMANSAPLGYARAVFNDACFALTIYIVFITQAIPLCDVGTSLSRAYLPILLFDTFFLRGGGGRRGGSLSLLFGTTTRWGRSRRFFNLFGGLCQDI